jgi:hypothetical protein
LERVLAKKLVFALRPQTRLIKTKQPFRTELKELCSNMAELNGAAVLLFEPGQLFCPAGERNRKCAAAKSQARMVLFKGYGIFEH